MLRKSASASMQSRGHARLTAHASANMAMKPLTQRRILFQVLSCSMIFSSFLFGAADAGIRPDGEIKKARLRFPWSFWKTGDGPLHAGCHDAGWKGTGCPVRPVLHTANEILFAMLRYAFGLDIYKKSAGQSGGPGRAQNCWHLDTKFTCVCNADKFRTVAVWAHSSIKDTHKNQLQGNYNTIY